jgi:hypothetical protein
MNSPEGTTNRLLSKWCDRYRDGGSFGWVVEENGDAFALFLQVCPWDHPSEHIEYGDLYVQVGSSPGTDGRRLMAGSPDEGLWIQRLMDADLRALDEPSRGRWAEMLEALRFRRRSSTG